MKKSNILYNEARRIRNTSRVVLSSQDYVNGKKMLECLDSKIKMFFAEYLASLDSNSFNDYVLTILKEFSDDCNENSVLKRLSFILSNRHSRLHSIFERLDSKFPSEYLKDDSSEVYNTNGVSYISDSCRTRIVRLKSSLKPLRVYAQEGLYSVFDMGTEASPHLTYIIR